MTFKFASKSVQRSTRWLGLLYVFIFTGVASAQDIPAPLKALEAQGVEIIQEFSAPERLTGYAVQMRGQSFAVYVTESGNHALVGTLLDSEGNDMSSKTVQALVEGPRLKANWDKLAESEWVLDGKPDADRVVYAFTDPNCPFCHKFWEASRPWIEAGEAQVRHIMVGILRPSSAGKAAAVLSADDPSKALADHERVYDQGGVDPLERIPGDIRAILSDNSQLMENVGARATPTLVYKTPDGEVHMVRGLPSPEKMTEMFGPKPE
ncbi:thiol:disulfide interchange protein DsbG [Marinobacter salicampi]|uniref:thiol:disulfide interchange protein DsbG n=1 Tax=Marinobacter salicampi TaxID=435907 RepID=UPI00140CD7C7|nr:thiol:disulfide interchange protein DsbG [Marinobacter salicampi]